MKLLIILAGSTLVGYLAVTRLAPIVQAKIEAMDLDDVWEVWDQS